MTRSTLAVVAYNLGQTAENIWGPASTLVILMKSALPPETVQAWREALEADEELRQAADTVCRLTPYTDGPLYDACRPLWLLLLEHVPGTTLFVACAPTKPAGWEL